MLGAWWSSLGGARRELRSTLEIGPRDRRYREAVARNLRWFERAGMLIAPDGGLGVREGLTSALGPDGKPTIAGCPRVDCVSECGLLFLLYGRAAKDPLWTDRGARMLRYTSGAFQVNTPNTWYFGHWQSRGEFRDDDSTVYVFNDDSGAATLFSLLGYAATGEAEQLRAGVTRGRVLLSGRLREDRSLRRHGPSRLRGVRA